MARPATSDRSPRLRALCWLPLLVVLAGADAGAGQILVPTYGPPRVVLSGNVVLPDEVYRELFEIAGLLLSKQPTGPDARLLAREVEDFLIRSGYELAQVVGTAEDGRIHLFIDEGRLTRVVFLGIGDVDTARLRLMLDIHGQVFHRPSLTRQLEAVRDDLRFTDVSFELIETRSVDHAGPQLDPDLLPGGVPGVSTHRPPGRYELHIHLGRSDWITGLGLHLDLKPPDGIRAGLSWAGGGLVFAEDRWQVRGDVAGNQFGRLVQPGAFIAVSRAALDLAWVSPPLFGLGLRPMVTPRLDYIRRQRPDLGLQSYESLHQTTLLSLSYDLAPGWAVMLGAGYQARWAFNIDQPLRPNDIPPVQEIEQVVGAVRLGLELRFDPENVRRDRHHDLSLVSELYFGTLGRPRWEVRAEYQKYFGFGWHDLILRGRGIGRWGTLRFIDEESMGWFTRGVFGSRHWTRRAAGATAEFRYSLIRDVLKVNAFVDGAVFEKPGRRVVPHRVMGAVAPGAGFNVLFYDTFQADYYYSVGVDSDGVVEHGFSASLTKAF